MLDGAQLWCLSISLGLQLGQESGLAVVNLSVTLSMRQPLGGPALLGATSLEGGLLVGRVGTDGGVGLLVDGLQLCGQREFD